MNEHEEMKARLQGELLKTAPAHNLLTELFRALVDAMGMTDERWGELIEINRSQPTQPGIIRTSGVATVAAIKRVFSSSSMTIVTFTKALRYLRLTSFTLTLKAEFKDRPSVTVERRVDLSDNETKE